VWCVRWERERSDVEDGTLDSLFGRMIVVKRENEGIG